MKSNTSEAKLLLIQILTVVLLFGFASYGLWKIGLIRLPGLVPNKADESINDYAEKSSKIFDYLSCTPTYEVSKSYPKISKDKLCELLGTLSEYDNYYHECHTELYSGKSSAVTKIVSRVSKDRYNVELFGADEKPKKSCVCDGQRVLVTTYSGTSAEMAVYDCGIFDFFSDAGLVSLDEFKDLPLEEYESTVFSVSDENSDLISVAYSYERGTASVRNSYLISLDYGLVLEAECYENDVLYYKLTTDSIYPIDDFADDLFNTDK